MRLSLFSSVVLVGVFSAASAGWLGMRLSVPSEGQSVFASAIEDSAAPAPAQPGVRNRSSWQPSPIPGQGAQAQVPSAPAPSVAVPGPLQVAPAPAQPVPAPVTAPSTAAGAPSAPYVPFEQLFTTDRLEAAFAGTLPVEQGEWREVRFFSRALGREVSYMAWLPPGYSGAGAERAYPALYLLHGAGGPAGYGVEEWLGYALTEDLDRMLALGLIEPMIVILPNGEQGYWMNHAGGGPRWADFVAVDLVKHVDATFRTEARREKRAVGGLSMGGHGALQLALNHPDVFSIAGAHSPTLRSFEDSPEFFGDQKWFAQYDPLALIKSSDAARRVAFWVDAGHEDKWLPSAAAVAKALEGKRASVTYKVLEGEHEGWYWNYYLPEFLSFYAQALNTTATTPQGAPEIAYRPIGPLVFNAMDASGGLPALARPAIG
jgi:enterochelin esterase-like enzyme